MDVDTAPEPDANHGDEVFESIHQHNSILSQEETLNPSFSEEQDNHETVEFVFSLLSPQVLRFRSREKAFLFFFFFCLP